LLINYQFKELFQPAYSLIATGAAAGEAAEGMAVGEKGWTIPGSVVRCPHKLTSKAHSRSGAMSCPWHPSALTQGGKSAQPLPCKREPS